MQKTIALSFLCVFSLVSNTWAWVGGPFSNNSTTGDGNTGTYQGTMEGSNLTGIVIFGISSTGVSGGQYAVFRNGIVTVGFLQANLDNISKKIVGIFTTGLPGFFNAKITETAPAVLFRGSGEFQLGVTSFSFGISGVRTQAGALSGPGLTPAPGFSPVGAPTPTFVTGT